MQSQASPPADAGETIDFGGYRVLVKRGTVPSLFISAAGIGNPFADTPSALSMVFEWQGAFRRLGTREHVIFLQDRRRSWFNDTHGWDALVEFLRSYVREHRIERTLAFGLSMGATGAVRIDRELGCDTVVAISPQAVVGVGPPHDARFQFLWEKIERIAFANLAECLRPEARCHVLFSIDAPEDVRHAKALAAGHPNARLLAIHGPHNLGVEMARFGKLDEFAAAVVSGDPASLEPFGFFEPDPALFELEEAEGEARAQSLLAFGLSRPGQLPESCFEAFHAALISSRAAAGETRDSALARNPFPAHAAQQVASEALGRYASRGWEPASQGGLRAAARSASIRLRVMDWETRGARVELALVAEAPMRLRLWTDSEEIGLATEGGALAVAFEARGPDVEIFVALPAKVEPALLRWTGLQVTPRLAH